MTLFTDVFARLHDFVKNQNRKKRFKKKTLVVGPSEPVDGDSLASTLALIRYLRKQGKQAYTLPTLTMFPQLAWMVEAGDIHPACVDKCATNFTTDNLQAMFDAVCAVDKPDEIVLVDGQVGRIGFDTRDVPVYIVDHHVDSGSRDDKDAYIQQAPAVGCLLIDKFGIYEPILAVSIFTDTYWLRENQPADAIDSLARLRKHGGLTNELLVFYQQKLRVPKDPRILHALRKCDLYIEGDAAMAIVESPEKDIHRGVTGDLGYYYSNLCVVRGDGYTSMRTNNPDVDLAALGARFNGGGHKGKAVARLSGMMATPNNLWREFTNEIHKSTKR